MVALKEIPFNGCQINGYVLLYHSGGFIKCCTIDFCRIESRISIMSAIVKLNKKIQISYQKVWIKFSIIYKIYHIKIQITYQIISTWKLRFLFCSHRTIIVIRFPINPKQPMTNIITPSIQNLNRLLAYSKDGSIYS